MTNKEAAALINSKFPKAKVTESMIDVTEEGITVWHKNGDRDFFTLKGQYVGHKDY